MNKKMLASARNPLLDIDALSRCFFPPDCRKRADVAIIFGMSAPHRPVELAVDIFDAGLTPKLLFTGGFNQRLGCPEAHVMAELAQQRGVPAEAILIEDEALNTEENVRFSHRLLEDRLGPGSFGSAMLVTIQYHLRRACLAARRQFPVDVDLCWTCYESLHYTSDNWFEVERGRRDVMTEIGKIEAYYGLTPDDLLGREG